MIFAPALKDKYGNECGGIDDGGGCMINGYCEPEAYISLAAELGIGIPVLSAGIGIQVRVFAFLGAQTYSFLMSALVS